MRRSQNQMYSAYFIEESNSTAGILKHVCGRHTAAHNLRAAGSAHKDEHAQRRAQRHHIVTWSPAWGQSLSMKRQGTVQDSSGYHQWETICIWTASAAVARRSVMFVCSRIDDRRQNSSSSKYQSDRKSEHHLQPSGGGGGGRAQQAVDAPFNKC